MEYYHAFVFALFVKFLWNFNEDMKSLFTVFMINFTHYYLCCRIGSFNNRLVLSTTS